MTTIQTNRVSIRAAKPHEVTVVIGLLHSTGLPDAGLAEHSETLLVAEHDQEIVGSAGLELYGTSALLRSVSVRPSQQGVGLGQRLTRSALDLARQKGVQQVFLLTETAGDFFLRFGFQQISRSDVPPAVKESVEFVSACPDSALVMAVKL